MNNTDNMKVTKILKGIQIETLIHSNMDNVYKYWFNPPQYLPPLKKIIKMDFRIGGTFEMICMDGAGGDLVVNCIFRSIVTNKEIVYEWASSNLSCQVSIVYFPGSQRDTTSIIVKQLALGNKSDADKEEMAHRFTLAYVAGMKAVFEKMKK